MSEEDERNLVGKWMEDRKAAGCDLRLATAMAEDYARKLEHWIKYLHGSHGTTMVDCPGKETIIEVVGKIDDAAKREREATNSLASKGYKP